jgi:hypothetical protein
MDTKTLTFAEIAAWLRTRSAPYFTPPTDAEVENAIESLVEQGIVAVAGTRRTTTSACT